MSLPVALALLLPAFAADPLLDVGVHGFSGVAGGLSEPMAADLPLQAGVTLLGWITPTVGAGLRVDAGSFGLVSGDEGNIFAFAEAQVRLSPDWSAGLDLGMPLISFDHYCVAAPCGQGLWGDPLPLVALQASRDLEFGVLHLPVGLRAELSQPRWALGLDLGVGLRAHR